MKLLNGTIVTGLLLVSGACADGYSNLSPSGNQSRKFSDLGSKTDDSSSDDSNSDDSNSDDSSSDDSSSDDSSSDSSPGRKGGNSSESGSDLVRGSNAWFAQESVEHALMLAVLNNPEVATSVSETSTAIQGQVSTVEITLVSGAKLSYSCNMFDSSSRGGTVLKKDVSCRVAR